MRISKSYILVLILLLAIGLRFYKLDSYPVNLTPDEASLGYNAYSIWETGRDEYGKLLPIVFKSFADYKPGLYVYLTVPFVAVLGLNEWAVRLPSAIAGVIAVWLMYLLVDKLFVFGKGAPSRPLLRKGRSALPLIVAMILAVSPWHIQFSRGAWEANVALTMVLGGVYLFLTSVNESDRIASSTTIAKAKSHLQGRLPAMTFGSAGLFGLSLWMYQGAKLSTLLVILALAVVYGRQIWSRFSVKVISVWIGILGLLAAPIAWGLVSGQTGGRLAVKSVLSYERSIDGVREAILDPAGISVGSWQHILWHGEWLNTVRMILSRYGNHFSGKFLGFEGDWVHPWLSTPYMGTMYWASVLFLIIGITQQITNKKDNNLFLFLLIWLFLAPVPSALTLDEVNAVRSLNMVIPISFFVGIGWWAAFRWLGSRGTMMRLIGLIAMVGMMGYQLVYYLDSYYVLAPKLTANEGQGYGYEQVVDAVLPYRNTTNKIVVYQSYDQPYIYWLFYERVDPSKYQEIAHLDENRYGDVGLVGKIDDQVEFREFSLNAEKHLSGNIYVGPPEKMVLGSDGDWDKLKVLKDVNYPNGKTAFRVAEIK